MSGAEGSAVEAHDQFLLALHRASREEPIGSFQDRAFVALQALIPFDGAFWLRAGMENGAVRVYGHHTFRLAPGLREVWTPLEERDVLGRAAFAALGRTVNATARDVVTDREVLERVVEAFGLEHAMATCLVDPLTSLISAVTVIRGAAGPRFSEEERRLKERLTPHLVEAYGTRRLIHLMETRHRDPGSGYATAACDGEALLHVASKDFLALLRAEWPAWQGPTLPSALAAFLDGGKPYRGAGIVVRYEPVNELIWLRARKRRPADDLSAREAEVARLSAAGQSNKEIAQTRGVSPFTVRNQLSAIYGKLDLSTRAELAVQVTELDY
jgi:DNA-binding CsgD family transcriptional regulator